MSISSLRRCWYRGDSTGDPGSKRDRSAANLASEEGALVDQMFRVQIYIIAFIFSLIVVFMLYGAVVFRRKPGTRARGRISGATP